MTTLLRDDLNDYDLMLAAAGHSERPAKPCRLCQDDPRGVCWHHDPDYPQRRRLNEPATDTGD